MGRSSIPRTWLPALLLALLPGLGSQPAYAQPPALFSAVEAEPTNQAAIPAAESDPTGPTVLRQRFVELDFALLATARTTGAAEAAAATLPTFTLNLFADAVFPAHVTRVAATRSGGYALSGHLAGEPLSTFTLVVNGDTVAGSVLTPWDSYEIESTTDLPGGYEIRQVDLSSLPAGAEPPSLPPDSEQPADPAAGSGEAAGPDSATPTVIDVAVFYTPAARQGWGGVAQAEATIDLQVAQTNQAYVDSDVNQRIRLVHRAEIDYTEADGYTDWARLRQPSDGHMDEVHTIRTQVGADLVALMLNITGVCGVAAKDDPFSVTGARCTNLVFAHELGHNMGLNHDQPSQTPLTSPPSQDPARGPHQCSFGYVNQRALDEDDPPVSARWRTIMAYNDKCMAKGIFCAVLPRFSNADQQYNGDRLGIPCRESEPTPASARETLNHTAGTVAGWKARVDAPIFLSSVADRKYIKGSAVPGLPLPEASAGDGLLTYTISPTLPTGLTFNATTRTISGTPGAFQSATTYTYTATDTDDDTASVTFTITITAAPSFGTATIPAQTYIHNVPIDELTLPAASGGDGSLTYTLSPIPAGLTLSGRTLSGTPTQVQEATAQTWTATDVDGDAATLGFTLTVEADTKPSFGNATIPTQTYTRNVPIPALTLPTAGGNGPLTYSLGPDLPDGLSFDADTRSLSGTPTAAVPLTNYPYTATDANGDTTTLPCYLAVVTPVSTEPGNTGGNTGSGNTSGGGGGGGGIPDPAVLHGFFESPADGATVAGIDLIRGWTFAAARGVTIERVDLYLDGRRAAVIPCCSARADVRERFPTLPRTTTSRSGWGIIQNWGNLAAGEHTVQVVVRSSDGGRWDSERRRITVLKPGDIAYADRFSLAEAEARIEGRQVVLTGVVIRDQATQAEQELEARYEWRTGAQGLRLVASRTLQTARSQPVGLVRLLTGVWHWLSPRRVTANPGIERFYEAPADQARVAGIGLIRGWAFPVDETDAVATVTIDIDEGTRRESAPCCSTRPDIAAAYPDQPNALLSGWGAVTNYGNLREGEHTLAVRIATAAGLEATEEHTVTVARLGGYAFVDRFDLSGATVELVGEEVILSGVEVRDSATQATQTIEVRLRWSRATQGLVIVDTEVMP